MGGNPEGDGGHEKPGEKGGNGRGPRIPDWGNGERAKVGVSGGGYWNPGESSGKGDFGESRLKNAVGDGGGSGSPDGGVGGRGLG